jgi:hypothetical protein
MTASLGGIDALVFTGGVGERSPHVRAAAIDGLGFLGVDLDSEQNQRATGERDLDVSSLSRVPHARRHLARGCRDRDAGARRAGNRGRDLGARRHDEHRAEALS